MSSLTYSPIQRKPRKLRKPRIRPRFNQIKKIGAEIECYWSKEKLGEYSFPDIDYDGSVEFEGHSNGNDECDGACRENCDCSNYCECDECLQCNICEHSTGACECNECLMCLDCNNQYEDCDCTIEKSDECKNKECNKDNNVCDNCLELFYDAQDIQRDCNEANNASYMCNWECNCECQCECDCNNNNDGQVGEIVSPAFSNVVDLKEFIDKYYGTETNSSCGLHIHVSVKNEKAYKRLMTKAFNVYFLRQAEKFAHENKIGYKEGILTNMLKAKSQFWKRLEGQNTYCKREFIPKIQFRNEDKSDTRYRQLNFCYNLIGKNRHKNHTIECRLFPCFRDKKISLKAIQFFYDLINSFLNREYNNKALDILKPKTQGINEVIVLGV